MRMDPIGDHDPIPIFSFESASPLPIDPPNELATGSDIDIGGLSTCQLTAVPSTSTLPTPPPSPGAGPSSSPTSHIAFHGHMSLQVPAKYAGRMRTGYASFRNRKRLHLFGEEVWDLSMQSHIKVVVGYRGWEGWRNRWMCNIQTDGPIRWVSFLSPRHVARCRWEIRARKADPGCAEPTYGNTALPSLLHPHLQHPATLSISPIRHQHSPPYTSPSPPSSGPILAKPCLTK